MNSKQQDENVWQCVQTEQGPDLKLFRARFDWVRNPRNLHTVKATVLEAQDWVNVVALTPEGKVLVVYQYRFGTQRVTTEIPAGIIEDGETSHEAAIRELKEETGYTSDEWEYLGYVEPNPAFLDNRCHHWLARNAERTQPPEPDEGENVVVGELSEEELRQEIEVGRMRHSLALTALSRVLDVWRVEE